MSKVFIQHVEELGCKFDTGWSTTGDDKREEALPFLVGSCWQARMLKIRQDLVPDVTGIVDGFEKVAIFEAFDSMWIRR